MTTKISTGSYDLNKWLFGGYDKDIITTLYGPAGSGKTNFCLTVCTSQARKNRKVIYIDTEGGFSVDRLKQLIGNKENVEEILEKIVVLKPTTFEEQWKAFGKLIKELKDTSSEIGLIIVDGMAMLYRLELAESREDLGKVREINARLAGQMKMLASVARKREIPVIVTNQVYSDFLSREDIESGKQAGVRMVGGDILKYWSKCIIELRQEKGKRKAIIRKHRSLKEKEMSFEIVNEGIKRRGIF